MRQLFSLAFGIEAVVLVEMGMPSYKVDHYDPKINKVMARLSLDLLEEKRDTACIRTTAYKERIARKRDLVLKKAKVTIRHTSKGKLVPNWEEPYQVTRREWKWCIQTSTSLMEHQSHEHGMPTT